MPRHNVRCPKCHQQYRELKHLTKCYPTYNTAQIEAVHTSTREKMYAFSDKSHIREIDLFNVMMVHGAPRAFFPTLLKIVESQLLGHTIMDRGEVPPAPAPVATVTTVDDGSDFPDDDITAPDTRQSSSRPKAIATRSGQTPTRQPLVSPSDDAETDKAEWNPDEERSYTSTKGTIKKIVWTKDSRALAQSEGLYDCVPLSHKKVQEFKTYLITKDPTRKAAAIKTMLSRLRKMLFFMLKDGDTGDILEYNPEVFFASPIRFRSYFMALQNATMGGDGVRNYIRIAQDFMNMETLDCPVTNLVLSNKIQQCKLSTNLLFKAQNKRAKKSRADTVFNEMLEEEKIPTIDQTTHVVHFAPVLENAKAAIAKAKDGHKLSHTQYLHVVRYCISLVLAEHFQRPGVTNNLTVGEFIAAINKSNKKVILVRDHKTSTKQPASLAFSAEQYAMLNDYYIYVRGKNLEGDECPATSPFFRQFNGNPFSANTGKELKRLQDQHGLQNYTADHIRTSVEQANTRQFGSLLKENQQVSRYLTHSTEVAKAYYTTDTVEDILAARALIDDLRAKQQEEALAKPADSSTPETTTSNPDAPQDEEFYRKYPVTLDSSAPKLDETLEFMKKLGSDEDHKQAKASAKKLQSNWRYRKNTLAIQEHVKSLTIRPTPDEAEKILSIHHWKDHNASYLFKEFDAAHTPRPQRISRLEKQKELEDHIREQNWPGLVIKPKTGNRGRSVLAGMHFEKGHIVCDYQGTRRSGKAAREYIAEAEKGPSTSTSYLFQFNYNEQMHCIDARSEEDWKHTTGRLFAHSPKHTNITPIVQVLPMAEYPQILFKANMDVSPGTELMFNYGDVSDVRHEWFFICPCEKCRPADQEDNTKDEEEDPSSLPTIPVQQSCHMVDVHQPADVQPTSPAKFSPLRHSTITVSPTRTPGKRVPRTVLTNAVVYDSDRICSVALGKRARSVDSDEQPDKTLKHSQSLIHKYWPSNDPSKRHPPISPARDNETPSAKALDKGLVISADTFFKAKDFPKKLKKKARISLDAQLIKSRLIKPKNLQNKKDKHPLGY